MIKFSIDQNEIKLTALILDMDGVLVDTEPIHMEAFRLFLEQNGLGYTQELLESFIGYSIEDNIKNIIEEYNLHQTLSLQEGIQQRDTIYLSLINRQVLKVNYGIYELMDFCIDHHVDLALASSSSYEQINAILKNLAQNYPATEMSFNQFNAIVSGDDVINKKPAPDIYNLMLKKLAKHPENCVALEDSPAGIESAEKAGLYVIGLVTPYIEKVKLRKANWLVESVAEIVEQWRKG
jgi:beta-phosphoglucomutase-like phosphatase (HAD superfamily)